MVKRPSRGTFEMGHDCQVPELEKRVIYGRVVSAENILNLW